MVSLYLIIILFVLLVGTFKVKRRGYFWKDRDGMKLTFKQFLKRWRSGVEGITPLQQTKTTLWSYPFLFGGLVWGIVVTLLSKTYWMSLILGASLPITGMSLVSTVQRFFAQKKIDDLMKNAKPIKEVKRRKKKSRKN